MKILYNINRSLFAVCMQEKEKENFTKNPAKNFMYNKIAIINPIQKIKMAVPHQNVNQNNNENKFHHIFISYQRFIYENPILYSQFYFTELKKLLEQIINQDLKLDLNNYEINQTEFFKFSNEFLALINTMQFSNLADYISNKEIIKIISKDLYQTYILKYKDIFDSILYGINNQNLLLEKFYKFSNEIYKKFQHNINTYECNTYHQILIICLNKILKSNLQKLETIFQELNILNLKNFFDIKVEYQMKINQLEAIINETVKIIKYTQRFFSILFLFLIFSVLIFIIFPILLIKLITFFLFLGACITYIYDLLTSAIFYEFLLFIMCVIIGFYIFLYFQKEENIIALKFYYILLKIKAKNLLMKIFSNSFFN